MLSGVALAALVAATTAIVIGRNSDKPADWSIRLEKGLTLAKIIQPEDVLITASLRDIDRHFQPLMLEAAEGQELEAECPGFVERYHRAWRQAFEGRLREEMPAIWRATAELHATYLPPDQLDQLARFFGGPVGASVIRAGLDEPTDPALRYEQLMSGSLAFQSIASTLSPAELNELRTFSKTPAARAASRLTPELRKMMLDWAKAGEQEDVERLGEVAEQVFKEMGCEVAEAQK